MKVGPVWKIPFPHSMTWFLVRVIRLVYGVVGLLWPNYSTSSPDDFQVNVDLSELTTYRRRFYSNLRRPIPHTEFGHQLQTTTRYRFHLPRPGVPSPPSSKKVLMWVIGWTSKKVNDKGTGTRRVINLRLYQGTGKTLGTHRLGGPTSPVETRLVLSTRTDGPL